MIAETGHDLRVAARVPRHPREQPLHANVRSRSRRRPLLMLYRCAEDGPWRRGPLHVLRFRRGAPVVVRTLNRAPASARTLWLRRRQRRERRAGHQNGTGDPHTRTGLRDSRAPPRRRVATRTAAATLCVRLDRTEGRTPRTTTGQGVTGGCGVRIPSAGLDAEPAI